MAPRDKCPPPKRFRAPTRPLLQSSSDAGGHCAPAEPGGCAPHTRGGVPASRASSADAPAPRPVGRPGRWHGSRHRRHAWPAATRACGHAGSAAASNSSRSDSGDVAETAGRSSDSRALGSSLPPLGKMPRSGSTRPQFGGQAPRGPFRLAQTLPNRGWVPIVSRTWGL